MNWKDTIKRVPYTIPGVALAWASLGNFLTWPEVAGLRAACGVFAACIMALVVAKVALFPSSIVHATKNPVLWSSFATFYMALMTLSTYEAVASTMFARVLWVAAVAGQFCHVAHFTVRHLRKMPWREWFGTFLIVYVGIGVSAVTAPASGLQAAGEAVCVFAACMLVLLLPPITVRYLRHFDMPDALRPTIGILMAPFAIVCTGYCDCDPAPALWLVAVLVTFAVAYYAAVTAQIPRIIRANKEFTATFSCFSFPLAINAAATFAAAGAFEAGGWAQAALACHAAFGVQVAIALVLVPYITYRFAKNTLQG